LTDPIHDAEINCVGNLRVLEAVRLLNPGAVVVYTSSSTVIGKAEGDLVDEKHGEKPLDIYSANKGVAEKYYRIYHRVHDLKTVMLRFANLYGPYGKGFPEFGFVNYFLNLAWTDQEIKIFGSGKQTRNVTYVEDATEILYRAAQEPKLFGEVFFATHEEHLSVIEIAERMIQIFGRAKCRDTRAAQRFFAERRIPVHYVDLAERGLSKGELQNVARAVGLRTLYDATKDTTVRYAAPSETKLTEMLLADPRLLKTPIVRDGPRAACGADPDAWQAFADAARSG
jgi:arsenate reductase